jgi:subtilisin family serine protease
VANPTVEQQVERILDENSSRTVSVILQGVPPGLAEAVREAARNALRTRSITRARALLPARATPPRSGDAAAATRGQEVAAIRRAGDDALRPVETSSFISASRLARRSDARGQPRLLRLAGAAVLEIDRDDLARLPAELPAAMAVYPNRRIAVPPRMRSVDVPLQVSRRATHAWGLEQTGALACWGSFGARGQGVRVAVLDTGVNASHPDLAGKVTKFAEFDAKGQIVRQGVPQARDDDGHGTHVCGTIVGGRESGRWIGMAPEAKLHVAKVLNKSGGTDEQILAGLEWAVAGGADVINMSLGALSFEPDVLDTYSAAIAAARSAGIPVIVSIGNDGAQVTGSPGNDLFALAVGASDVADCIAAFSGGRTQVIEKSKVIDAKDLPFVYSKPDLCAPGVDVYSCAGSKGWAYESGSSMAAPHVAGAAALLLSKLSGVPESVLRTLPGFERTEVIHDLLAGSVHELGENGQDHRYGWGRLSVLGAYSSAVELDFIAVA